VTTSSPPTIEIQGHFGEDGALEGTIAVHGHQMPWTAERLPARE
jgi:hypothetical protein